MNTWNTLTKEQMEQHSLDHTITEEVLQWYHEYIVNGIFETEIQGVDTATMACMENVDGEEVPMIRGTIYKNGKKVKEVTNYLQAAIDAKDVFDNDDGSLLEESSNESKG